VAAGGSFFEGLQK